MNWIAPHPWDLTPAAMMAIQRELAQRVVREGPPVVAGRVAGVDVGFEDGGRITRAAVVVLDMPSRRVVDMALARVPTSLPYIPGLLAFREWPAVTVITLQPGQAMINDVLNPDFPLDRPLNSEGTMKFTLWPTRGLAACGRHLCAHAPHP